MAENIPIRRKRSQPAPPPVRAVTAPPTPAHLSREASRMWKQINDEWLLGLDALPLLRAALESWDLYQTCRVQVKKEGPTVTTGGGMIRQHPAVKVGNDALTQFRMCFRQLGLEPPK